MTEITIFSFNLEFIDVKEVLILFWYGNYSKGILSTLHMVELAYGDLSVFVKEGDKIC